LLLRAGAHRPVDGGVEVAASPDTPRREAWQWHVRVLEGRSGHGEEQADVERLTLSLPRSGGLPAVLEVSCDPDAAAARAEVVISGEPVTLERDVHEVTVLVVGQGGVRVEGRHLLHELDAMVLEGDDPLRPELERVGEEPTSVAVVRLRSTASQPISWVP
jgi:hypothetical protein